MFLRSKKRSKGRQDAPLFQCGGESAVGRGGCTAAGFVFGRDQRQPASGVAPEGWKFLIEAEQRAATLSLFPEDREIPADALDGVQVKLREMELRRPRALGITGWAASCGASWAGRIWQARLGEGREEVPWAKVLELLVVSRLVSPGSEFRLHRQGFDQSAMGDLLGTGFAVAERTAVSLPGPDFYRTRPLCLSTCASAAGAVSGAFLTCCSTISQHLHRGEGEAIPKAKHGYSRGPSRRLPAGGDCPGGDAGRFSAGLRSDGGQHLGPHDATRVSRQDRSAVWTGAAGVVDGPGNSHRRVLAEMRAPEREVFYLGGTPRGKIQQYEKKWLELPWQKVRDSVEVSCSPRRGNYTCCEERRTAGQRAAIRRRKLVRLLWKLRDLRRKSPTRDQMLAPHRRGQEGGRAGLRFRAYSPAQGGRSRHRQTFTFQLDKDKLQKAELRDGHYLLRSNLTGEDGRSAVGNSTSTHPESKRRLRRSRASWACGRLSPVGKPGRSPHPGGLPRLRPLRDAKTKTAALLLASLRGPCWKSWRQFRCWMFCLPTTDGRWLIMTRYTQPEPDQP